MPPSNILKKIKTPLGIVISSLILVFLLFSAAVAAAISSIHAHNESGNIAPNTWVNTVNVSGMNVQQAAETLAEYYESYPLGIEIHLESSGITQELPLGMLDVEINFEATAQAAHAIGRSASTFQNITWYARHFFAPTTLPLTITTNEDVIHDFVNDLADRISEQTQLFEINEYSLTLSINREALDSLVDVDATVRSVINSIAAGQPGEARVVTSENSGLSRKAALVRARVPSEPINASVVTGIKEVILVEEQSGIAFDMQRLEQILANRAVPANIPIQLIPAEITKEALQELLFRDVLSEFTTYFNSPWGRTHNIRLSASKIDGTILAPESYFSFNEIVGRRTTQAGFAIGGVFFGGRITEGIGGGICQTSTTIYGAALYADLKIIERHNHSFTVGYAPLGQDAAVSWGTLDLVFKNNQEFPIKIITETSNRHITVRILGTNTNPEKTIELQHIRIATRPFTTTYRVNPDSSATRNVTYQIGITGHTIDSFKITRINGYEVSREFLHRSVYVPLNRIVLTPQTYSNPFVPPADNHGHSSLPSIEDWSP